MTNLTGEQTTAVTADIPPDPTAVMQLATGYWSSAVLLAANDLDLFAALSDAPKTAAQVAGSLGADRRGVERLLDACCGLNLVVKQGEVYMLPSMSEAFFVPGRPYYLGHALRWARDQWNAWGRLAEAARSGRPVAAPEIHLGQDAEQTRNFVLGMHERAAGLARGVANFLDLEGCEALLDVGGGPGTYAVLLAQRYPDLRATVLDLPPIVAVAKELIAQAGLSDRVQTLPGDAASGEYGEAYYDAVLFSGVLHQMGEETIRRMLAGAHRALAAAGRIIISDFMVDATRTQPLFSALFSVQMLLSSQEGAVFSVEQCTEWLESAGFADRQIQRLPPPLPYTVVTARKS